jgi:hypothetical protein
VPNDTLVALETFFLLKLVWKLGRASPEKIGLDSLVGRWVLNCFLKCRMDNRGSYGTNIILLVIRVFAQSHVGSVGMS